jgi:hypothetical protein
MHEMGFIGDIWQRNYYEHIIRNETEYARIAEYINNNPILWEKDRFYRELLTYFSKEFFFAACEKSGLEIKQL